MRLNSEPGQGTEEERRSKDYRQELEERERLAKRQKDIEARPGVHNAAAISNIDTSFSGASSTHGQPPSKKSKSDVNLDADDPVEASDDDDDDDSSDDEDDTAALMAELQRIKKERMAEQARKEAEKRAEEERIRAENILSGNPLLNYSGPGGSGPTKGDMKVRSYGVKYTSEV